MVPGIDLLCSGLDQSHEWPNAMCARVQVLDYRCSGSYWSGSDGRHEYSKAKRSSPYVSTSGSYTDESSSLYCG